MDEEISIPKDHCLIQEGDLDRSLYIVKTGSVRLIRTDEKGEAREIMRLGIGTMFGEMSLITGLPRTCSVTSNEDTVVLQLKNKAFEQLISRYQNLKLRIALMVEQRLLEHEKIGAQLTVPRSSTPRSGVLPHPIVKSGSGNELTSKKHVIHKSQSLEIPFTF